jgi:hypothetical protein
VLLCARIVAELFMLLRSDNHTMSPVGAEVCLDPFYPSADRSRLRLRCRFTLR